MCACECEWVNMSDWVWVNEWVSEWMSVGKWVLLMKCEWVVWVSVSEWVWVSVSGWVWMSERDWVGEWVSVWLAASELKLVSEWANEWESKWVRVWVWACVRYYRIYMFWKNRTVLMAKKWKFMFSKSVKLRDIILFVDVWFQNKTALIVNKIKSTS